MKKLLTLGAIALISSSAFSVSVYSQNFDGGLASSGWTVSGSGPVWSDMATYQDDNYASTIAADQSNALTANNDFTGDVGPNALLTNLKSLKSEVNNMCRNLQNN